MIFLKPETKQGTPGIKQGTRAQFVDFWSSRYDASTDVLYEQNIIKPLTAERIRNLFVWKNGTRLSELKAKSVEKNFIKKADDLDKLPNDLSAAEFLTVSEWRCYLANLLAALLATGTVSYLRHACASRNGIHRTQSLTEIPSSDTAKVDAYINR